jgi:hypothetical protein
VGFSNALVGIFMLAANNAGLKLVTRFPPTEESDMYMAVSTSLTNIATGLGALTAGTLLKIGSGLLIDVGGLPLTVFPLIFIISGTLRLTAYFLFLPRVNEKGAPPEDKRRMLLPLFFRLPVPKRRDHSRE